MNNELYNEAKHFIVTCYQELGKTIEEAEERLLEIKNQIKENGMYEHTYDELKHGAKMAWRHSNRCIGRLFWDSLHVIDKRQVETEDGISKSLLEHIEYATNNGKIRSTLTVFKPESPNGANFRIINHQLLRYAGYKTASGIVGDPASIPFTELCTNLGWEKKYGEFDLLPLIIQKDNDEPRLYDIPQELILEVPILHPQFPWFENLKIKWYAVPIISDMVLEIGGIRYPAAPFNGWYMGTEVGARNLADEQRYNLLPKIAKGMGLDTAKNSSLWKDRALIELNTAVLYSYREHGVSMVDHHTAAQQFKRFEELEKQHERNVTGDWTWLIPPVSPATTHIFHTEYQDVVVKPNFFYQKSP